MTTPRPGLYPLHDLLGINVVFPEDSLYLQSGYPTGLAVPSADHNGKFARSGLWHKYVDLNSLRNEDWLRTGSTATLSATTLEYDVGGNVLTTGATVLTRGVHLVGGTRIETDAAFLNVVGGIQGDPLIYSTATAPGRIWVYANEDGSCRIESVGPAVADSPGLDEVTLVGLQIDGTGVVTDGALAPTTPLPAEMLNIEIDLRAVYLLLQSAGTVLDVIGGQVTAGDPAMTINSGLGPALTIASTSPTDDVVSIGNASSGTALHLSSAFGKALLAEASDAEPTIQVYGFGSGSGIDISHFGSGYGLLVDNSFSTKSAINALGPAGIDTVAATCDTAAAFKATVTSSGFGFNALGGPNAASVAVRGTSSHVDANAIDGFTANAANTTAAGVRGIGLGAGMGVHCLASGTGYAAIFTADTTSPSRAATRYIPQNADPTTNDQGAMLFNSARGAGGHLRYYTTQWESVHSSAKGWVRQWGASAAGGPIAGGSGNLSLAQISPEETGDVLVSATGSLEFSLDTGACTVHLLDVTSAVVIAIQTERAIDTDAVAPNVRSFAIRGIRTLPNTTTRTFAVVITATTGTITYANVVCMVEGVQ